MAGSLMLGGLALAQQPRPEQVNPGSTANEQTENVPDPEKIRRSADSVAKMRQALKDVLSKLEEARNSRDVVKLNCVNEKLTQVKGLLRISELADVSMQEAIAKKEDSTATHEFTKVTIAQTRVVQLRAEAEQCIGQLAFRTDENLLVDVDVPEDLPKGDPTTPQTPFNVGVRAPAASETL